MDIYKRFFVYIFGRALQFKRHPDGCLFLIAMRQHFRNYAVGGIKLQIIQESSSGFEMLIPYPIF